MTNDTPKIPPGDKLEGDRLFNSPVPMRLKPRDGARYPGFCPAPVPEEETDAPAAIDDGEAYQQRFSRLADIPPNQRRTDGG